MKIKSLAPFYKMCIICGKKYSITSTRNKSAEGKINSMTCNRVHSRLYNYRYRYNKIVNLRICFLKNVKQKKKKESAR